MARIVRFPRETHRRLPQGRQLADLLDRLALVKPKQAKALLRIAQNMMRHG
jgi:hypothetical protein